MPELKVEDAEIYLPCLDKLHDSENYFLAMALYFESVGLDNVGKFLINISKLSRI